MMDGEQWLSAAIAWGVAVLLMVLVLLVLRERRDVPWSTMAVFAVGALLLAMSVAITATTVVLNAMDSHTSEWLRITRIAMRALATACFLGVYMDLVQRPRIVARMVDRLITKRRHHA